MRCFLLLLSILPLSGCAELSLFAWTQKSRFIENDLRHPVVEVMCLWEPGEGQGVDRLPTRGFAGQMYFITHGRAQPARVKGDVVISVFDDVGTPEELSKPIHNFEFSSEAWNTFLRETTIGPSYQLFVPYTRKGRDQASCSLMVKFTPADGGPPVFSKMSTVVLTGRRRAGSEPKTVSPEPEVKIVQTSHQTQAASEPPTLLPVSPADRQAARENLARLREAARSAAASAGEPVVAPEDVVPPEEAPGRFHVSEDAQPIDEPMAARYRLAP